MTSLTDARRRTVDELKDTRVIRALFDETLDRDAYIRYLTNVYYYAQFSPRLMATAAARCMSTHRELATYLLHHAEEEMGHELWALEDLRDLGVSEYEARAARPVPSCDAMVGYVHYIADHGNPIGLFGWMYVLEGVGSDFGIVAAERLKQALGEAASAVRFVEQHGINDADHADDLAQQIDRYLILDDDRATVTHVADVVRDLYLRMFREIGGEEPRWK